jgi:flagellar basal-body rod protein FlgG
MNDALYIAATAMQSQQLNVATIANNLANVATPGFKKGKVSFSDLVYRGLSQQAAPADGQGMSYGTGVGIASLSNSFVVGDLNLTNNPLDLAIRGDGFLEVEMPDGGLAYARGGTLVVNKDGLLATTGGYPLKPEIHVGTDVKQITIGADGAVLVQPRDGSAATEVGRIELANFSDLTGLSAVGNGLYKSTDRSGDAVYGKPGLDGYGAIAQGYLEASNVKMTDEMVNLMVAQRAYELSTKVIQASDEMLQMSNNLRR